MKTATVRELRNSFSKLEGWLREGEQICIEKRGEPIAILRGTSGARRKAAFKMPDFAARREAIWGQRVFSEAEVLSMRADELEGEEG